MTNYGLSCPQLPNHMRHISPPTNQHDSQSITREDPVHKIRHLLGIQKHSDQRGRPMEGRIQDPLWPIPTTGYVLWTH